MSGPTMVSRKMQKTPKKEIAIAEALGKTLKLSMS